MMMCRICFSSVLNCSVSALMMQSPFRHLTGLRKGDVCRGLPLSTGSGGRQNAGKHDLLFQIEQELLAPQAAAVAAQLAAFVHHAMARNDDADPVEAIRPANGTLCFGGPNFKGQVFI